MANTTIEELLNLAYEVRDADQAGENTALRVGGLLEEIIQYLSTVVGLDTLQEILEGYATVAGNGVINWRQSRIICLASMGYDLDNIDGGNWNYTNFNGDIVFRPSSSGGYLNVVGTTDDYSVLQNVVYVNNHTGHAYLWKLVGNTYKMVEIRDSSTTTIITYLNTPPFSQVAVGESYFYASGSTRKIAIKLSSDEVYSFDPDPKKIYVFLDTKQAMVWDSGNRQWISVGGNLIQIINDLTTGGGDKALSADMGVLIKQNVNAVQANIIRLYNKLANMAFLNAEDKAAAAPQELNWQVPKKTLTIANNIEHAVVMYNGASVSSVHVDAGDTISLIIQGATGWAVSSVSASGATVIDNQDGTFTVRVKVNNDMTLSISGTTVVVVVVVVGITTSNAAGALGLSNTSVQQGGTFVGQITYLDSDYNDFEIVSVKDEDNNDVAYSLNGDTITIANVPSDITITALAKYQLKVWFGKTLNIFGGMENTEDEECVTDFIKLPTLGSNTKAVWNAGGLTRKGSFPLMNDNRCLVFYDKNKRLLYWAGDYEIKRVSSYISCNDNMPRDIATGWLGKLFTAAGANTPVYVRMTCKCSGTTINSAVSLKQNSVELLDLSNYAATSEAVTQHTLSYTLSNAVVDNEQVPLVFPHNQPLEVSFKGATGYTLADSNIVVTMGGQTLTKGTDYTINTNSGYKTVRIENVTGDVNFNVSI